MGKLKEKVMDVFTDMEIMAGEMASDAWWEMVDQIEDRKEDLKEDIREALQNLAEYEGMDVEDVMELNDADLDDFIENHIYSEWDV